MKVSDFYSVVGSYKLNEPTHLLSDTIFCFTEEIVQDSADRRR